MAAQGPSLDLLHDDLALVRATIDGETSASCELVRRFGCITRLVRRINVLYEDGIAVQDEEDVVQNCMVALWAKLPIYDGRAPLESWCRGFAVRELRKHSVRRSRNRVELRAWLDDLEASDVHGRPVDSWEVQRALARLAPSMQRVVRLKSLEGCTFAEVAQCLRIPVGTAKTLYYRAIYCLRVRLAPLGRDLVKG